MKATHSGHCQACGSLQKLPSGKLSLHGYHVPYGFFSGICVGAKELPFEKSCGLVETFIASAKSQLANLVKTQAELRQPATSTTCWVNPYMRGHFKPHPFRGGHVWMQAELRTEDKPWAGLNDTRPIDEHITSIVFTNTHGYVTKGEEIVQLERYAKKATLNLLDVATKQNGERADWLELEAKRLRRYIAWQSERVRTWTEQPLLPLKTKDDKTSIRCGVMNTTQRQSTQIIMSMDAEEIQRLRSYLNRILAQVAAAEALPGSDAGALSWHLKKIKELCEASR